MTEAVRKPIRLSPEVQALERERLRRLEENAEQQAMTVREFLLRRDPLPPVEAFVLAENLQILILKIDQCREVLWHNMCRLEQCERVWWVSIGAALGAMFTMALMSLG